MPPVEPFEWVLWQIGYTICHQLGDRSLSVDGHQYPIDARMSGLFLGFLLVTIYLLARGRWGRRGLPDRIVIGASLVGLLALSIDGATSYSGLRETTNPLRLATGLGSGAAVGLFLPPMWASIAGGSGTPGSAAETAPVATWRDLLPVGGSLAIVGAALLTVTSGVWFFHMAAVAIVVGYLVSLHLGLRLAAAGLLSRRIPALLRGRTATLFALALQAFVMAVLWAAHRTADSHLRAG